MLGVSPTARVKHAKFREKYGLPFTLLSDEEHEVAEQYGTWVEKSMYGKTYLGMERSTFVIDADGKVAKVMRKVKPAEHADDVLAALPEPTRLARNRHCAVTSASPGDRVGAEPYDLGRGSPASGGSR